MGQAEYPNRKLFFGSRVPMAILWQEIDKIRPIVKLGARLDV